MNAGVPDKRTVRRLRAATAISASVSLAALLAHVFGILKMSQFLTFLGAPSLVLILALVIQAKRIKATAFLACLQAGIVGGFLATLAYDLSRVLLYQAHVFRYDGFKAIYLFGSWITGHPADTAAAAVAGWLYHFWNGLSFGVFYTLTFGRRTPLFGIGYGVAMELCMLGIFPFFIRVSSQFDFVALSLIGHIVYGWVMGLWAQRHALNWGEEAGVTPASGTGR